MADSLFESPQDWEAQGLCREVDPDLWFPDRGGSTAAAKSICQRCPVRSQCLAKALARDERYGVWGGTTEWDRRKMRRHGLGVLTSPPVSG